MGTVDRKHHTHLSSIDQNSLPPRPQKVRIRALQLELPWIPAHNPDYAVSDICHVGEMWDRGTLDREVVFPDAGVYDGCGGHFGIAKFNGRGNVVRPTDPGGFMVVCETGVYHILAKYTVDW
jgi:hypothetical protein